ncbi:flagellin N-terminal helical domain-containing protein [Dethiosulfovibrio salsuginis]|uniref:Flagellin n=1 Tax=Dethiosulfovibrio salsuginis TaxID=561720 RepID=A0A1X7J0K1_9BACT|nr:flagellin [Dethiosulfovibrio salsuginis]SMG20292.1 flagellin C-terminal helical region [Dethiosulfovibrio salsuginis]
MIINNNISSLRAVNILTRTNRDITGALAKLSSGLRISQAADDAAGLGITEGMRSQYRGLDRAIQNSQDGINMIQTAEGALGEVHSILQKMRELSVNAASDTLTVNDRGFIQLEMDQLVDEIDRISQTTQFNKKKLLNGDSAALVSSSRLDVDVIVRGGLRSTDIFGQKKAQEGNYRIEVEAESTGRGQVLKSNIFKVIDHGEFLLSQSGMGMGYAMSSSSGISVSPAGNIASGSTKLYDIDRFWDRNGRFLIEDPQLLTVIQGDGKRASVTIYKDDTLRDLAEKVSIAILAGLGQGSGDDYVDISGAGGDPAAAESAIIEGLKNGWLEASAKRIKDYYGMDATSTAYSESVRVNILTDAPYGILAMASSGYAHNGTTVTKKDFVLNLDAADFSPGTGESGVSRQVEDGMKLYNDRIIAHEMVHLLVGTTIFTEQVGVNNDIPIWMNEGLAELIHGADERLLGLEGGTVDGLDATEISNYISKAIAWDGSDQAYAGAYLMVRAMVQNGTAGDSSIKNILAAIQGDAADGLTDGEVASAVAGSTNFTSGTVAGLAAEIKTWAENNFKVGGAHEITAAMLTNDDTGAIGGLDVSGGSALNAEAVVNESGTTSSDQPLSSYGWTVVYPSGTPSNTWESASAAMVWSSDNPMVVRGVNGVYSPTDSGIDFNSVNGTLVVHSGIVGKAGELSFSGDEDLLNALGFTEIQSSEDAVYSVTVRDAHSGKALKEGLRISGPELIGAVHSNVDVSLGVNAAISAVWDVKSGSYRFSGGRDNSMAFDVHLADNTTVFQIGANEREDLAIDMGKMSTSALGLDGILVIDRDHASRAISSIDSAIERVSIQRSKLGSYEKRLEHAIANLTVSYTNLVESESRIRDVDMAKEMMNFTRLNIYLQSGNAMLGQANQVPQAVLQLIR